MHFLTMELVEGKPLDRLIPSGGLPIDRLLDGGRAAGGRAGRGARQGHRASRSEARERDGDGRRAREGARLRSGQGRRVAAAPGTDAETMVQTSEGVVMGTVAVHVARAGGRAPSRSSDGRVFPGRDAPRTGNGRAALPGLEPGGAAVVDSSGHAGRQLPVAGPDVPPSPVAADRTVPREEPRSAHPDRAGRPQ